MNDEQFEILVGLINETREELRGEIASVKAELKSEIAETKEELQKGFTQEIFETKFYLIHTINELKEEIKTNREINARQHQEIIEMLEDRYSSLEKDIKEVKNDISILHILSKKNQEDHKRYEAIFAKNGLK